MQLAPSACSDPSFRSGDPLQNNNDPYTMNGSHLLFHGETLVTGRRGTYVRATRRDQLCRGSASGLSPPKPGLNPKNKIKPRADAG